jgi:hypothetical protein
MKIFILLILIFTAGKNLTAQELPSDHAATKQTVQLYRNLKEISKKGILFGHQDDLAYGVNWKYKPGNSDVKEVTGDYPAVYGWELGHLEVGAEVNLDSVPFDKMRAYISLAYQKGGIITISWHGTNPMTGKTAWDPETGTVESILPGGDKHDVFKAQLDKVADFMVSLKGNKGELVPVIFRPFHEHTGGWFWWGNKTTGDDVYKKLFRFTVQYLKDIKKVHNLLYAYNTGSEFSDAATYLQRYPGDDVVDVVSFDTYQNGNPAIDSSWQVKTSRLLSVIEKIAVEKNKIAALAEVGFNKIPYDQWWTNTLYKTISGHRIAYVLLWRNAGYKAKENELEYYVPYKGHASENDFKTFYHLPQTLFQSDLNYKMIYE